MPLRNTQQVYGAVARTLHWATALFIVGAWPLGQFLDAFPRGPARDVALLVHMSFGLAVILLVASRIVWRTLDRPPPAIRADRFEPWLSVGASAGHLLLYALMLAAPILGILTQFARGRGVPIVGLFEIASPWAADRDFAHTMLKLHEFCADALGIVALGHAAMALFHHWALRDRTLARMLPGLAR